MNVPSSERPSLAKEDYPIIFYQNTSTACNYFIYFINISIPDLEFLESKDLVCLGNESISNVLVFHACLSNK